MKNVVLHIGTGKTGTSTIQNALYESREVLRKSGVDYADIARVKIDHFGEEITAHYELIEMLRRGDLAELKALRDYIANNPADTIIFSCENLYHHLGYPLIEALHKVLAIFRVRVVCYIRRQDLYIESAYKQQVKIGERMLPFREFANRHIYKRFLGDVHANYYRMLKVWADEFGAENIIVRRFDKTCFRNGNLLDDFMACLGLESITLNSPHSGKTNSALPSELILLIRAFNDTGLIPGESQQDFVEYLRSNYEFRDYPLVDLALRRRIAYNYGMSNLALDELFGLEDKWSGESLLTDIAPTAEEVNERSDFELLASIFYSDWAESAHKNSGRHLKRRLYYKAIDSLLLLRILFGQYNVDESLKRSDYFSLLRKMIFGSRFSPAYYRRSNLDIRESGLDPFVHYIYYGISEGRIPHPRVSVFEAKKMTIAIKDGSYEFQAARDRLLDKLDKSASIRRVLSDDIT